MPNNKREEAIEQAMKAAEITIHPKCDCDRCVNNRHWLNGFRAGAASIDRVQVVPTDKEVWLEYGWLVDNTVTGSRNMLWYNEGNAHEFAYWFRAFMQKLRTNEPRGRMYFLWRVGSTVIVDAVLAEMEVKNES